ncbi:glycosyltransferase [Cytobacillus horneckiae]|uniref:Glycosyltransferase n=1 Tax=Cytobacillus horneckiae TaxID=549687 RepID=A0A2N0ZE25_9BACI|nr:glycosyltransferase [Cytobacillus horneckiae]MCM3180820.1 glycosyltransferase [Cytobacillus horneckiae]MEC1157474.1 glycosyltransferase [Cytobacillus horneckiae]MED2939422.1 glycosyltransferase [Cytobacillus horneckiae]PKG27761.1 glycosyltransferase [Cytobacillus horneckiae]
MKTKMLFVIDSLECAGAEKSLVTLLSLLNYSKYSVDLMLFGHGGELEKLVPNEVNILEPLKYTEFSNMNLSEAIYYSIANVNINLLIARMKYSMSIRKKKYSNAQKARVFWKSISNVIENNPKTYDIAISYAQGVPTFYVAEKIKAKKKYAWVNVSYRLEENDKVFQRKYYNLYDKIVAVSDSTKEVLSETFPEYSERIEVIYDINNPKLISGMAGIGKSYEDDYDGLRILTIGRLAQQKGYDMALEACKMLKEKGHKFRWYVLGKGPLEKVIKEKIKEYNLIENFILLGVKANPYPYIKNADIYVQTSRFEGFGLAIAEARMLNIPIVTTKFDAVFNQMIDGENGLVVDMNGKAVYEGIVRLIRNQAIYNHILAYLSSEKKGNIEELDKFYQLIEERKQVVQ